MKKELCQNCGARAPSWAERFPGSGSGFMTCGACGSFSYFGPVDKPPADLYGRAYFETDEYLDYEAHAKVHALNFRRKLALIGRFVNGPMKLFELGCAYGFFLEQALKGGAEEAYGVDVSPEVVAKARERVGAGRVGLASEGRMPSKGVNCLVAWDVWEHLPEPFEQFSSCCAGLEKGAVVAISTVDSSALAARLRGKKWRQIHPPTHLHYPTRLALKNVFESLGLDVVHHRSFGYYRALQMYGSALGLRLSEPKGLASLPVYLNLYDIQMVIGRKR